MDQTQHVGAAAYEDLVQYRIRAGVGYTTEATIGDRPLATGGQF